MINMIIALMVEKGFMERWEGEALVDKLKFSTFPADYASAEALMKKMLSQIQKEK